jgi:hypothetical protein
MQWATFHLYTKHMFHNTQNVCYKQQCHRKRQIIIPSHNFACTSFVPWHATFPASVFCSTAIPNVDMLLTVHCCMWLYGQAVGFCDSINSFLTSWTTARCCHLTCDSVQCVCQIMSCCSSKHAYIYIYTGCNRRNGPNFGRVFLMLNYTEKPQNTYIQSW